MSDELYDREQIIRELQSVAAELKRRGTTMQIKNEKQAKIRIDALKACVHALNSLLAAINTMEIDELRKEFEALKEKLESKLEGK